MIVIYHKLFQKQFKKLDPKLQQQFQERIKLFIDNRHDKFLNNHSVGAKYPSCRSINITGDYRAIYSEAGNTATFLMIGTHSQLY
jgi:addiction module RelE/StbE family toxin